MLIRKYSVLGVIAILVACQSQDVSFIPEVGTEADADKLMIVDCLLPGQIRKLGAGATYVTPRRPAKLAAVDCEARGGEYIAYEQANSASALKVWLPAAQQGDAEAQTYVGEIYEKGFGIQPDYKLAALWYQRAVGQGHARAKLNLGYLYERGLGMQRDLALALSLYRSASGFENTDLAFTAMLDEQSHMVTGDADLLQLAKRLELQHQEIEAQTLALQQQAQQLEQKSQSLQEKQGELAEQQTELQQQAQQQQAQQQQAQQTTPQSSAVNKNTDTVPPAAQKSKSVKSASRVTVIPAQPNSPERLAIAGPSIQLINPPMVNMRGMVEITVPPDIKTREIVGSVAAPAGVELVRVNGRQEKLDANGLFRVLLPVSQNRQTVEVEAQDKLGKRSKLAFQLVQRKTVVAAEDEVAPEVDAVAGEMGGFHALVIGNNDYSQFAELKTAVNDAQRVADILSNQYGFKTITLLNANRFMVLSALNRLGKRLSEKDNLLVYYAGHGELSSDTKLGYWLPVDAARGNKRNWIPNTVISDVINTVAAKRVLVVADSCYSGSLTSSSLARAEQTLSDSERLLWLRAMAKSKARIALTSGGLKPVADNSASQHSLFASAFIDALKANQGILEGQRLYGMLSPQVVLAAQSLNLQQQPRYAPIRHAGHESGEFFFLPRRPG